MSFIKKHFLLQFTAISFALLLGAYPSVASARLVTYADAQNLATDIPIPQSFFQQESSCTLERPANRWDFSTWRTYTIDVPDNKKIFTGSQQPTVFSAGGAIPTFWVCDPDWNWRNIPLAQREAQLEPVDATQRLLIAIISRLLWVSGVVAGWLIWIASQLLVPLLSVGKFVTHPIVSNGWPLIQGFANLGFIVALLFIAGATVLRLDNFGVRRMLPRLLIAALLINFSLVLGGLLVDISRLVMAIIVRALGVTNLDTLAKEILSASDLVNGVYKTSSLSLIELRDSASPSWRGVQNILLANLMIGALAVSFLVIAVGLLIRYIMLILLLVVSPLAFLALALPAADGLAKKWWSTFLKYVLYGPVAMFILALIPTVADVNAGENILGQPNTGSILDILLTIVMVCALSVGAAIAGKQLGTVGAAATVGFVAGQSKRLGRTATAPARFVGRETSNAVKSQAGDFYKAGKQSVRARVFGAKPGDKSLGTKAGERMFGKPTTKAQKQQRANDVATARNTAAPMLRGISSKDSPVDSDAVQSAPSLTAVNLRKGPFASELLKQNENNINKLGRHANQSQLSALVTNEDLVRDMTDAQRVNLEINIRQNQSLGNREKSSILSSLTKKIGDIEKKDGTTRDS